MDFFKKMFGDDDDENRENSVNKNNDVTKTMKNIQIEEELLLSELMDMLSSLEPSLLDKFNDPEFQKQIQQTHDSFPDNPNVGVIDTDLDGKLNTDQIELFINQIPNITIEPIIGGVLPTTTQLPKVKRTDEEKIMDKIHGTAPVEEKSVRRSPGKNRLPAGHPPIPNHKMPFAPPAGYEKFTPSRNPPPSTNDGRMFRTFGQTIITQTVRKPDGSVEVRRTVRDNDGTTKTTISKTLQDGKTETITSYGGQNAQQQKILSSSPNLAIIGGRSGTASVGSNGGIGTILNLDQNMYISRDGYTLPRNMW